MSFDELLGPSHRVYAPFLAVSVLLAAIAWRRTRSNTSLLRYLFPRRLFWHRSSRLDVAWLGVRALVSWPLRFSVLGVALVVCGAVRDRFGASPLAGWPLPDRTPIFVLFSIVLFLADDLSRWLVHRAMHAVPALWQLHQVHHAAEVLTPLTLYRVHPIESALNQIRGGLSTGLVTGLFMFTFPGALRSFEVLGVDALGFVWTAVGANLRHSHVWLTFPPWIERWLISPAQHQLHHARTGVRGNYGSALAVWDRLFGSLVLSEGKRPPRVGVPRAERNHRPTLISALVSPLAAIGGGWLGGGWLGRRWLNRWRPSRPRPCTPRSADLLPYARSRPRWARGTTP